MKNKQLSTSALAKKNNMPVKEMFAFLLQHGLIEKKGDHWSLTNEGVKKGGKFVNSEKFGKYITWPDDLEIIGTAQGQQLISAAQIGKHFGISAQKINYILSELGWTQKYIKGWRVTLQGEKAGGLQHEDKRTGVPYVKWPSSILESKIVLKSIQDVKGTSEPEEEKEEPTEASPNFREKFQAKHRTTDGHFVRSKAEMIIDNWLYMAEIVHAYERKLPIEEEVYSDFYIPQGKVYIEFWGYENEEKYLARKKVKQEIYQKYGFNLIELTDEDVLNIDDTLPGQLLKFGIQAY